MDTLAHTRSMILQLAAEGVGFGEIARRLNAMGLRTRANRPWGRDNVCNKVCRWYRQLKEKGERVPRRRNQLDFSSNQLAGRARDALPGVGLTAAETEQEGGPAA
jgi:hypothetical protein